MKNTARAGVPAWGNETGSRSRNRPLSRKSSTVTEVAPSKAPGQISGACGPSHLHHFRTGSGGACAPWWPPSTSDYSTAHGARILAVPGDAVNAARRRTRGNCAPQLLRNLCSAGCVWGGRVPKPLAPRRSAERPAGSAEREAGARKRRCCCFLSSLQLRSRAHGFRARLQLKRAAVATPGVERQARVPGGVQREGGGCGGGGALAAEAPPLHDRLPALLLRSQPHHVEGLVGLRRPRGWQRACGARLPGPAATALPVPSWPTPASARRVAPRPELHRWAPSAGGRGGCPGGRRIPGPLSPPGPSVGASLCPGRLRPSRPVPTAPDGLASYWAASSPAG